MSEREKTYVEDVNRSIYDIRNEEKDVYRIKKGLTPDIVAEISEKRRIPHGWQISDYSLCRSIMRWKFPTGVPLLRV